LAPQEEQGTEKKKVSGDEVVGNAAAWQRMDCRLLNGGEMAKSSARAGESRAQAKRAIGGLGPLSGAPKKEKRARRQWQGQTAPKHQ
jgi:hypothetical protein